MSDDVAEAFEGEPTDDADAADESREPDGGNGGNGGPDARGDREHDDGRDVRRYLNLAALGVLAVLALVATLRFYFAASSAIDTWVAREYRSLFQAAFNLVVLLAAVGGLALQLRRLDR